MTDLALRTQGLLQSPLEALNSLPFWLALGLLFAPTLLSLFTRRWITIAATALLNFACLVLLGAGRAPEIAGPVMIVTFAASLIVALFGLHENQLWQRVSGLDAKVTQVEEQMMTFLRALEGRSDMIDQRGSKRVWLLRRLVKRLRTRASRHSLLRQLSRCLRRAHIRIHLEAHLREALLHQR
jgi:hypothetical protein